MKIQVIDLDNTPVGDIDLDDGVFDVPERPDLLARMVVYQRSRRRQGTRKTRGIGEISGSTRKPHRQKGTGRARQGSVRSAQHRGGQTTFGPQVRSHAIDLPKKVRRLALKAALSARRRTGDLVVLDAATVDAPKTKALAARLTALGWGSALIVDSAPERNFVLASRNIPQIDIVPTAGANVLDILRRDKLVLTRTAVAGLQERLQ